MERSTETIFRRTLSVQFGGSVRHCTEQVVRMNRIQFRIGPAAIRFTVDAPWQHSRADNECAVTFRPATVYVSFC